MYSMELCIGKHLGISTGSCSVEHCLSRVVLPGNSIFFYSGDLDHGANEQQC